MISDSVQSIALSVVVASSYVAAFQTHTPCEIRQKPRDDPKVIRHRVKRISVLCVVLVAIAVMCDSSSLRSMGVVPGYTNNHSLYEDLRQVGQSLGLILVLYMGPIFQYFVSIKIGGYDLAHTVYHDLMSEFASLSGFRDHVFAPLTEELIYRGIICYILLEHGHFPREQVMRYSPVLFGVAHVHHAVELYRVKGLPVSMVGLNALIQTVYTSLFGILASYVYFVKFGTASLWNAVVVHSVCNLIGFPDLVVVVTGSQQDVRSWWVNGVYYALIAGGIYGFVKLL